MATTFAAMRARLGEPPADRRARTPALDGFLAGRRDRDAA